MMQEFVCEKTCFYEGRLYRAGDLVLFAQVPCEHFRALVENVVKEPVKKVGRPSVSK